MKRLMKFFNSGNSDPDYDGSTFDTFDKDNLSANLEEHDSTNPILEDVTTEYFEQPKRKKGRPRKMKALIDSDEGIPTGIFS
jgi:hypothetical protein